MSTLSRKVPKQVFGFIGQTTPPVNNLPLNVLHVQTIACLTGNTWFVTIICLINTM